MIAVYIRIMANYRILTTPIVGDTTASKMAYSFDTRQQPVSPPQPVFSTSARKEGRSSQGSSLGTSDGLLRFTPNGCNPYESGPADVEAQKAVPFAAERQVSHKEKLLLLTTWFVLNLALTISNKAILRKVYNRC